MTERCVGLAFLSNDYLLCSFSMVTATGFFRFFLQADFSPSFFSWLVSFFSLYTTGLIPDELFLLYTTGLIPDELFLFIHHWPNPRWVIISSIPSGVTPGFFPVEYHGLCYRWFSSNLLRAQISF